MRVQHALLTSLVLSGLLAACGGSSAPVTAPSSPAAAPASSAAAAKPAGSTAASSSGGGVKLTGAGSTADFPLFTKIFDAWGKQAGGQVNYQSVGSGAGIEQLTKKTVDFGASDAIMTDDQEKAAGAPVVHLPVTLGAVSVGYNLPGVTNLNLDADTLSGIYLGTIK